ncbi:MAG: hypothetical protein PHQ23_13410 [Candidatus Wallbacteria bacterium]|nr:hypothetical protein [Candidatus Wallbacteria bacterium]
MNDMINPSEYYRDPNILRCMIEYCGGKTAGPVTAESGQPLDSSSELKQAAGTMTTEYLVGWGKKLLEERGRGFESVPLASIGWLMDNGFDIFRSVWDRSHLLLVIDVEYFSKRYPQIPYLDQDYTFCRLEPFYRLIRNGLESFGIHPFVLTTGQGYHFVFQVKIGSPAYIELSAIGHMEDTLKGKYEHLAPDTRRARPVTEEEGKAYDGAGRLLEYLYHLLIEEIRKTGSEIPFLIGDIASGNENMEAVSFDLSGYANPIFMRDIRVAFSTHQKHKAKSYKAGCEAAGMIPIQLSVPRVIPGCLDIELGEVLHNRRNYAHTANMASGVHCNIPDAGKGVLKLIASYKKSQLYNFHQDFDRTEQEHFTRWHQTYDRFDLGRLPPCVSHALANPNPHLLQPTQLQTLVRVLAGRNWWHPKHIAGLIRSKYERNHGWEVDFHKYDANTWACTWTRIYAGMLADGADDRCDFNCLSHQQKGIAWADKAYCVKPDCGYSLGDYR